MAYRRICRTQTKKLNQVINSSSKYSSKGCQLHGRMILFKANLNQHSMSIAEIVKCMKMQEDISDIPQAKQDDHDSSSERDHNGKRNSDSRKDLSKSDGRNKRGGDSKKTGNTRVDNKDTCQVHYSLKWGDCFLNSRGNDYRPVITGYKSISSSKEKSAAT
jgi:hypothetical protein